jgi:hypothetical protein
MKASLVTWSVIVGITLAIWIFFYAVDLRLDAPATTVIAGFSVALVYGGKWLGQLLLNRRRPE